jgi:hypothetical protein
MTTRELRKLVRFMRREGVRHIIDSGVDVELFEHSPPKIQRITSKPRQLDIPAPQTQPIQLVKPQDPKAPPPGTTKEEEMLFYSSMP